jgi:hypothetical protein
MACPTSPKDGYHRFKLAHNGAEFATACQYGGAEKTLRPFEAEDAVPTYRPHVDHARQRTTP